MGGAARRQEVDGGRWDGDDTVDGARWPVAGASEGSDGGAAGAPASRRCVSRGT